jgi:hypothetical protein
MNQQRETVYVISADYAGYLQSQSFHPAVRDEEEIDIAGLGGGLGRFRCAKGETLPMSLMLEPGVGRNPGCHSLLTVGNPAPIDVRKKAD